MPPTPANAKARTGGGLLVQHAESMASVMRRLHVANDALMFWNEQCSFKLMLRNDPVDPDTLACELALVTDEDSDGAAMLEMCSDGYMDEPGTYVIDSWSFPLEGFGAEDAAKVMHAVNDAYLIRACPCGRYLIKDDAPMCTFCDMISGPQQRAAHFCPICCDDGLAMHMQRMPCCQQRLHRHCMDAWKAKSGDARCPMCRQ